MQVCKVCLVEKEFSCFSPSKTNKTKFEYTCKLCRNEKHRKQYHEDPEVYASRAEYRARNAAKLAEVSKEYREKFKQELYKKRRLPENLARKKENDHAYGQANPDKICAKAAKRRASKLKATPPWAELEEIKKVYTKSKQMEEETGEKYHVDHIVPLNSRFVSGLHCLANLQILPGSENCQKSNVHWPDMPDKLDYRQLCKDHSNSLKHTIIELEVEVAQVAPDEFFEKYKL